MSDRCVMRVCELPVVLLSYDEPWADEAAAQLRSLVPGLIRVHGVKGLDACHKAAAEAAGTDFLVTVDADTAMHPSFLSVTVPDNLVSDHVRLSWHSLNIVNGLPSGNGSLKVWPRALIMAMKTHEAAPPDRVSIDHDLGDVAPGHSRNVVLPGIHSTTNPARTPEHAFRAGLREAVYLDHLIGELGRKFGADSYRVTNLRAILSAWINLGRHSLNGLWTILGARLWLWMARTHQGRDPRMVNDYSAMKALWQEWVLPRFMPGGTRCALTGATWDAALLDDEVRELGRKLAGLPGPLPAEFSAEQSGVITGLGILPAHHNGDPLDGLGWAMLQGKGVRRDTDAARCQFEAAMALGHAAAPLNLAQMIEKGLIAEEGDPGEILRLYRLADASGNPNAARHLERLVSASDVGARTGA